MENKKRIFSGVKPSGGLTLGNYLGALKNWVMLQDSYDCIYSVADLHAITVRQDPASLRKASFELFAMFLAAGIDENKSLIFIQSSVPEHSQLTWILSCNTAMGELMRMTQYKDKSQKHADNINAGLFTYPVLMAADILLYSTDLVPVGDDQKQHLELSRDIAARFNGIYGDTFTLADGYIPKQAARVMSLQNPLSKMSKSDESEAGYIAMTDTTDVIIKKFKRAVTDSDMLVEYKEGKHGVNNLIEIYGAVTGKTNDETAREFANKGYGDFKLAVGEAVASHLKPIQEKYNYFLKNKDYINETAVKHAERASIIASKTLGKVYKKVGFYTEYNK